MMAHINRFIFTFLFISIFSCADKNNDGVYLPNIHKNVSCVREIEQNGVEIEFVQYFGFKIKVNDSILGEGLCHGISIDDVLDKKEIEKLKKDRIQKITFFGQDFKFKDFKQNYGLSIINKKKTAKKNMYDVFLNTKKVGYLIIVHFAKLELSEINIVG